METVNLTEGNSVSRNCRKEKFPDRISERKIPEGGIYYNFFFHVKFIFFQNCRIKFTKQKILIYYRKVQNWFPSDD